MLSAQFIRENADRVRADLARRGANADLDAILELDASRRDLLQQVESMRAERNSANKEIGKTKDPDERNRRIEAMRELNAKLDDLETQLKSVEERLEAQLYEVPNILDDARPRAAPTTPRMSSSRRPERLPQFDFEPRPHWELAEILNGIDFERGVKMSGSRFFILQGPVARLHRALIQFMLNAHTDAGFEEVYLPYMLTEESLRASGQLPKFRDNLYRDAEEDYYFIPTAEVALVNYYRDEIIPPGDLPRRFVAHTPCFRREKMSAGRDTRGIKRVHQFEKVEMFIYCEPEQSEAELDLLVGRARALPDALGLSHRLLELCSGDVGFNASRTFDIEVWAPGAGEWLEVSSASNCLDFQARRANIRYRPSADASARLPHMLNASGLGLVRTLIAVMENYQEADGSIRIPEALQPYMGMERISPPA
ncbi:MAG: serine--tRNA ligase [Dehalococcoidia bacterium]|nr:serine--tRNA ligase [Dehalococcoidia bacterium]